MRTIIHAKHLLLVLLLSSIISCALAPSATITNDNPNPPLKPTQDYNLSELQDNLYSTPTTVFLPTVQKEFPLQTIFGVQTSRIFQNQELSLISALGISWTRKDLFWSVVESEEGKYNWDAISDFEEDLRNTSAKNIRTILVINKTPDWARQYPESECGPIKQEKFDAFGKFMSEVVKRYSSPPFNVLYYEIWNEPDVDPALFDYQGKGIGCWGNDTDEYYGGGNYADMLKRIHQPIKSANPNAQILVGGLLLDCDPRGDPSGCENIGNNPKPAKFLEGILKNNGKDYFDGISFHAYDQYYGEKGKFGISNWNSSWNTTGPTVIAKANFIKEVLIENNAKDKFLMNTETAVLCADCTNDRNYEITKAYYIPQVYSAALSLGLRANLWYSSFGWRNSGLILIKDGTPQGQQPAYDAYFHSRETLLNSRFEKELNLGDGIMGYEFYREKTQIWVVWSLDGEPHPIDLSKMPLKITNHEGKRLDLETPQRITITIEPLYIEFQN